MAGFLILADKKNDSYNLILVIVDQFTNMIHYEPVKVTINTLDLAKMIINVVMHYHGVLKLIVILRVAIYIKVLVLAILLSRDQKEAIYSFLPINRWPNRETK